MHYADGDLGAEIRRLAVDALHGRATSRRARVLGWLDVCAAVGWFLASYAALVFLPLGPVGLVFATISAGLAVTACLTHVVHPLMHHSVASTPRRNEIAAHLLTPFGVSLRWWVVKHNIGHHGYPSVAGHDPDVDQGSVLRYDRTQPWRPWHRAQHVYAWFLYPFLLIRYVVYTDLPFIFTGADKGIRFESPSVRRTAVLLLDKMLAAAVLLTPAFLLHSPVDVLVVILVVLMVAGLSTALVFVPNHFGDETPATVASPDGLIGVDFASTAVHGVANVKVRNPVGRWYMGGLDHHLEHHLLGWVPQSELARIAPLVEEAALAHGLPYRTHPSIVAGWRGHARRLHELGRRPAAVVVPPVVAAVD